MDKSKILHYTGNLAQICGARHYTLSDGWARNLRGIDVNTGNGLQYTILPDRGMDISLASFKGTNLVYITCNGETHPAYFEPEGIGWLHTFTGGLLTTCGLTYLGAPASDEGEKLGLHGRYSTIPAKQFADISGWAEENYVIRIRGTSEEGSLFGNKLRLEREIISLSGQNNIHICDKITNFGYNPSPYMILYHINLGYPILDEDAELIIDPLNTAPLNSAAESGLPDFKRFIKPEKGYKEQVFCHTMRSSEKDETSVLLQNKKLNISLQISFNTRQLPYLIQWKMMGPGEYVLGLEPSNVPRKNRSSLRNENTLPFLEPGESITNNLNIALFESN